MKFATPLIPGTLIRRYKRFLSDIELDDGRQVTAHCANPGAMTGLNAPGLRVWVEPNDDPKRKLRFAWRLAEPDGAWAGIDTGLPNKLVAEALAEGRIASLAHYTDVRAEVRYGDNSRVDFLLTGGGPGRLWLEVKNVHLVRQRGLAEFPDSVTRRGAKHLGELARRVEAGDRAMILYVVQYTGCDRLSVARDIDPAYGAAHDSARMAGVEFLAYATRIDPAGITLDRPLRIED